MSTHDRNISAVDFVPVAEAMERFPSGGPSLRFVRERMAELGFAQRIGRQYYTTAAQIEQFVSYVKEHGLCKTERHVQRLSRPSAKGAGTPAALSRSAMEVKSPESELNEVLAKLARRKSSARSSATT